MTTLERKAKRITHEYLGHSSKIFTDLKVWFKNFDVFKKRNRFYLNPYETLYSFNNCDVILNDSNIVVIGKIKIFGKEKCLTPTIFGFGKTSKEVKPRQVAIINIQEVGGDLEIEFSDANYYDRMKLVIKNPEAALKEKILNTYNIADALPG